MRALNHYLGIIGIFTAILGGTLICAQESRALADFAEELARLKIEGKPIPQFSAGFPENSLTKAYEVQEKYVSLLLKKKTFAGIKGAVVGKGGQDFFSLEGPLSAVLFREGWYDAKSKPSIPIRKNANPGIENELGIILSRRITGKIPNVVLLKTFVRGIVPVIELPAGAHDWPGKLNATDLVASNVDSDNYIVGKMTQDLSIDLDALRVELRYGEKIMNQSTGGNAHRGQWWNFLHQVNWAVERGYPLEENTLIITGALGKIVKHKAGSYRADYGPLGTIEFSLKSGK